MSGHRYKATCLGGVWEASWGVLERLRGQNEDCGSLLKASLAVLVGISRQNGALLFSKLVKSLTLCYNYMKADNNYVPCVFSMIVEVQWGRNWEEKSILGSKLGREIGRGGILGRRGGVL